MMIFARREALNEALEICIEASAKGMGASECVRLIRELLEPWKPPAGALRGDAGPE